MASKFTRFESSWLQSVVISQEKMEKNTHNWSGAIDGTADGWLPQWRRDQACSSPFSVAVSVRPDQWCMFYTPSCNIFHKLLSTEFKSGEFGDDSSGGINSGVSLSNNAIARARWAFHVSQGSVETLFRWGGKRLYRVVANLFRKLCAKFRQNCLNFVGDITENILVSFFRTRCIFDCLI